MAAVFEGVTEVTQTDTQPLEGKYGLMRSDGTLVAPVRYTAVLWAKDGVAAMVNTLIAKVIAGLSGTLVYGAIALVTLVGVIKCIYPVLRNSALLNRAIMKLERSAASNERAVWREARFLGRSLRPDWQRFLLNAGQLDLRGMPQFRRLTQ